MKFTLEPDSDRNLIRAYSASEVRVGSSTFREPILVAPRALVTDWPARSIETLDLPQLEAARSLQPEVIVLGGSGGPAALAPQVRRALAAEGIGCEVMDLGAACRTYNLLVAEGREVVAGLFPRRTT